MAEEALAGTGSNQLGVTGPDAETRPAAAAGPGTDSCQAGLDDDSRSLASFDLGSLRFDDRGLIPCVVQQYDTGEVLMVAWMSAESIRLTLETGTTWFWSRSRKELWNKGATSGNIQQVKELWADCDSDTLLVKVDSPGPACHTGARSCFFRRIE